MGALMIKNDLINLVGKESMPDVKNNKEAGNIPVQSIPVFLEKIWGVRRLGKVT